MRCELPFCKKCCYFFPLRRGLIAWGYVKITTDIVLIAFASIILSDNKLQCSHFTVNYKTPCVIWILVLSLVIVDVIFDFIFLLATHTKDTKLMRYSSYYNIFLFIISNISFFFVLGHLVANFGTPGYPSLELLMTCISIGLINAVVQFYLILLIRSEIRKLNNDCCVTFENHGVDSKCFMTIGNIP